jgi:DNA-binding transcriptional LysR family regulator
MDFDRLRAFCFVGQSGGLLRAAQKLKLSPATISLRLKHLEAEVGVQLFEHKPNKLLLTDKGKLLLVEAQRILQHVDDSIASLRERDSKCEGNVSLLVGNDLARYIAPRVANFVENNPEVNLSILTSPSPESPALIVDGQADLGIGRFFNLPRSIQALPLFTSSIAAIYAKQHPLSHCKRISVRHLAAYGLIVPSQFSATRRVIHRVFSRNGLEIRTILEAGGCSLIREYAKLRLGVGLVHEICIRGKAEPDLCVRDLKHLFGAMDVLLIHRKDRPLTSAHKAFIAAISSSADQLGKSAGA